MSPLTARRNATGGALEGSFTTIVRGVSVMSALLDDGVPVSPKARSGFSPLGPLAKAPRLRVGLILVAAHSRLVLIAQEQVRLIFRALRGGAAARRTPDRLVLCRVGPVPAKYG